MVSPGDNSFFEIRDRPRELKLIFRRPDSKLLYKIEVILNGRKIVDHFTTKDTFRVHLGRHDHELKWRVQAFDQEENLVLANDFATLKVHHNERLRKIDLTLDRYSLKDKIIITWDKQDECESYDIFYDSKKFAQTKKLGALLNEHADSRIIKIACSDDHSHYGMVDLSPKKILSHAFLYEFYVMSFWFRQELDVPFVSDRTSRENYLMQVHGLGWQMNWDKRKRNDVSTFFRYGRMLDFGNDAELLEVDLRFRFDVHPRIKEKLLVEFEGQRLTYNFDADSSAEQVMSFIGAGFETYSRIRNKVLKSAFLVKKELKSPKFSPSAKLRFYLPYSQKLSWIAEVDYGQFESELETGELSGVTDNTLTQVKFGISYLF